MENLQILQNEKSKPRVLVVDSDKFTRTFNTATFICFGCEVDAVIDCNEGWHALQSNNYDLLVVDFMPRVTGVELIHKMHLAGKAVPVIIATREHEIDSCHWFHAVTTLRPPFSSDELLEEARNICPSIPIQA